MLKSNISEGVHSAASVNENKKASFKMLTFPCEFQGGSKQSVHFYIGRPSPDAHPIGFQMKWLGAKGGNVPPTIVDALQRLAKISKEKNIPFIDLCEYVIANLK